MSTDAILVAAVRLLDRALGGYIEFVASVARELAQALGKTTPRLPWEPSPPSIDQRLAKLEVAKAALMESLSAVEELQRQAEDSKVEHERVRSELAAAVASKDDAERKLEAIQKLIAQDVEAFQTLAGVPNVGKERLLGFVSGVLASIIASSLVALIVWAWKKFVG
jgi:hypothetical protein